MSRVPMSLLSVQHSHEAAENVSSGSSCSCPSVAPIAEVPVDYFALGPHVPLDTIHGSLFPSLSVGTDGSVVS